MPLDITSPKPGENLTISPAPPSPNGSTFPNTEALQASGCFSSLLFYDNHCTDFCIRMSNYFVSADPGWYEKEDQDTILELQFALKGDLHYQLQDGIKLIRCPLLLHPSGRGIWRLLAPLTFAVTAAPVVFWRIIVSRPHTVVCVEPTLMSAPAVL